MNSRLIGGILLIIGTSIGGGMLALPLATAAGGYFHSLFLFLGAWLLTVSAAYMILEVNLWLEPNTNLISMAKATLGRTGQIITWLSYLLLLYSLLAAYIAGGSDLLSAVFSGLGFSFSSAADSIVFTLLLGAIVFQGIRTLDWANRTLMIIKVCAYGLLVLLILPHIQIYHLLEGQWRQLSGAVLVVITAFGYAIIVPSLRAYFESDVKKLRLAIFIGSLLPLLCYLLWDLAVQGSINSQGANGLVSIAQSPHPITKLTVQLSHTLQSDIISLVTHVFTYICVTTSFLGVSLCLVDFLADGLRIEKKGAGKWGVSALAFLPPLTVILFYPDAFIFGLKFAGVFCVILLILLPGIMVWSGRYRKKIAQGYRLWGGKVLLAVHLIAATALFLYGVAKIHW